MKRKKMFRNLFLLATVFAVFSVMYGCKQLSNDGGGTQTAEITVTVKKDANVKEAPENFKLEKGTELGFTELKKKMPNLEFEAGYELGKIRLEKASGKEITDVSKHKFDKDTTIFIVSKKYTPVFLKKLTIGKESKEGADITSEMHFEVAKSETEVAVVAETSPAGAKVSFAPALTDGKLKLTGNETILKITVGEDRKKSEYTVKVSYEPPIPIAVKYEINGKGRYALGSDFVRGIKEGTNPLIVLEANSLNLKLSFAVQVEKVKINNEIINGDSIKKKENVYTLLHSLQLGTDEKQIEITVYPENKDLYSSAVLKFKAKGNGNLESLKPVFSEISGDKNLSKLNFLDKLTDSSKPVYKTFGSSADLVISISGYEYEFLCKEVKINNKGVEIKEISGFYGSKYEIRESIPVTAAPADVKIEFMGKDGIANSLVWEFKIQSGGEKPKLPQSSVKIFRINGKGEQGNPLPKDFTEHLIDNSNPLYVFDGKKALIEVGCYDNTTIEKVVFKENGIQKAEVFPIAAGFSHISKYEFNFNDADEHSIQIIIYPKDMNYSELTYVFRLKSSGKNPPPKLTFTIDGTVKYNGYKETLRAETAIITVQSVEDVMLEVKIGEKDTDERVCTIEKFTNNQGNPVWEARREIDLPLDGNEKIFAVRVTPKNPLTYGEALCEYTLKGTKIPSDNAEFIQEIYGPRVRSKNLKWKPGLENTYIDGYGSTAVTLEAHTLSPRATVKYQIVDMEDKAINGQMVKTMTKVKGIHTSEEIIFFTDKPTRVKAWVIAEDGTTTDNENGIWKMTYNPIPLTWGYQNSLHGADYKTAAYDTVEVEAEKVKDNKIYLVFSPWNESEGYTVDNTNLPAYQTNFAELGAANQYQTYYKTSIDISSLLGSSPQTAELEAFLKIKKDDINCFTYKIKIKLKT